MKGKKSTVRHYVLTIKLRSESGKRPEVRTLGGDTIFVALDEGMTASWVIVKPKLRQKPRQIQSHNLKGGKHEC